MPDQVAIFRPNATVDGTGWDVAPSTSTHHAVTADDNSTTYVASTSGVSPLKLGFTGPGGVRWVLPDRAQIRRIRPYLTAECRTGTGGTSAVGIAARVWAQNIGHPELEHIDLFASQGILRRSLSALFYNPSGDPWSQADLDSLRLHVARRSGVDPDWPRIMEEELHVAFNLAPVVGVTEPSAPVTTTSKPTVRFAFSDQDGDAIERYHCYVYPESVYSAPDFVVPPPDSETNVGGARKPPGWVFAVGPVFAQGDPGYSLHDVLVDEPLTNGRYRAYVFVSDVGSKARYSAGDFIEWAQDVPAPGLPTLTAEVE
jgi:hypothetical protein